MKVASNAVHHTNPVPTKPGDAPDFHPIKPGHGHRGHHHHDHFEHRPHAPTRMPQHGNGTVPVR
ncbi:MAG: hypothetical protein IPJ65_27200 [Archangiaceae bacterium]|nr:hypothetical protein [Archangiaceae bacterium]